MTDRLIESANAIDEKILHNLWELQCLDYWMEVTRALTEECCPPVPPKHPSESKFLYHNESKVEIALFNSVGRIREKFNDPHSTEVERKLVLAHPMWSRLKHQHNVRLPELENPDDLHN